jgi:hypothetical protein
MSRPPKQQVDRQHGDEEDAGARDHEAEGASRAGKGTERRLRRGRKRPRRRESCSPSPRPGPWPRGFGQSTRGTPRWSLPPVNRMRWDQDAFPRVGSLVRAASLAVKLETSRTRASAGTTSPGRTRKTSAGTTSAVRRIRNWPSRLTSAFKATEFHLQNFSGRSPQPSQSTTHFPGTSDCPPPICPDRRLCAAGAWRYARILHRTRSDDSRQPPFWEGLSWRLRPSLNLN